MHRVVTVSGRSPGGSRCKVSAMAQRRAHVVWSERDQGTPNTPVHRPETPRKHRGNPSRTMRGDGDTLAPPSAASTLLDAGAGWRWVALGGAGWRNPSMHPSANEDRAHRAFGDGPEVLSAKPAPVLQPVSPGQGIHARIPTRRRCPQRRPVAACGTPGSLGARAPRQARHVARSICTPCLSERPVCDMLTIFSEPTLPYNGSNKSLAAVEPQDAYDAGVWLSCMGQVAPLPRRHDRGAPPWTRDACAVKKRGPR